VSKSKNRLSGIGNGQYPGAGRLGWPSWRGAAGFLRANAIRIAAQAALLGGVIAALAAAACGRSIFSMASASPTPTPSPTGSFAYVTNYNDGVVSEFRIRSTGALSFFGTVKAGAIQGPVGLAVSPSNDFLYAANSSDGRVYQFRIDSASGALTPIGIGSVSDGAGSGPQQIAIDPTGSFAYVTNFANGSISEYSINSSTGALSAIATATGLGAPLGVAANPSDGFIYVTNQGSGAGTGTVLGFAISASGVLGAPVVVGSLGSVTGTPGLPAIDPAGLFLYVPDINLNVVAEFTVSGATLAFVNPTIGTGSWPFDIALDPSGLFAYTANQTGNTISSFTVSAGSLVPGATATGLNVPTGIAIGPNSQFLYVTNQGNGTITQFSIDSVSGTLSAVATVNSESPANANSAPRFIAIAQ
jgi:6-phosphogluconolactonase (cycloisomerase 2 family)